MADEQTTAPTDNAPQQEPQQDAAPVTATPEPSKNSASQEKPVKHKTIRSALKAEFKKANSAEKAADAPKPTVEPQQQQQQKTADVEPILAPSSLNAEERAVWDQLPPQAQKFLARRAHETTADYNRRMQEVAAKEKQLGDWGTLSETREEAARLGLDPAMTYKTAIAWEKAFRANPKEAARQYLEAYGINPADLISQNGQQQQQQQAGQSAEFMTRQEFEQWQRQQQEALSLQQQQNSVDSFIKAKPLFRDPGTAQELEAKMAPIVAGMRLSDPNRAIGEVLEDAYNLVTRGDPRFAELVEKLNGREAAAKAAKDAEAAKAATRSISGGPGGGTPAIKPKTRREALSLAMQGRL